METNSLLIVSPYLIENGLLKNLKRDTNYRIVEATDPSRIKDTINDQTVDLIFIQGDVSGISLVEIIIHARGIDPDIQIIYVALSEQECIEDVIWRSGVDDVICQPLTEAQLNYRVARCVKMRRLNRSVNDLSRENHHLRKIATTDELTQLMNQRCFKERFAEEFARVRRFGGSVGCMLADIDNFNRINEIYGYQVGNQILREVSQLLLRDIRRLDIVARYSGEEFVMILPETVGSGLTFLAERLRKTIEQNNFPVIHDSSGGTERLTISIGISNYPDERVSKPQQLLDLADAAMIRAKKAGRNRVEVG
ncbi:MAG: diguanylate cyclase [Candidatus Electryoneaceae bacterium]|nr:diguanylate cyclase [Candidatus Electryoneaceae bacterium]